MKVVLLLSVGFAWLIRWSVGSTQTGKNWSVATTIANLQLAANSLQLLEWHYFSDLKSWNRFFHFRFTIHDFEVKKWDQAVTVFLNWWWSYQQLQQLCIGYRPWSDLKKNTIYLLSSISIKVFVREKQIRNRKKKERQKFFKMKANTKPLKFNKMRAGWWGRGGGGADRYMWGTGTPT